MIALSLTGSKIISTDVNNTLVLFSISDLTIEKPLNFSVMKLERSFVILFFSESVCVSVP